MVLFVVVWSKASLQLILATVFVNMFLQAIVRPYRKSSHTFSILLHNQTMDLVLQLTALLICVVGLLVGRITDLAAEIFGLPLIVVGFVYLGMNLFYHLVMQFRAWLSPKDEGELSGKKGKDNIPEYAARRVPAASSEPTDEQELYEFIDGILSDTVSEEYARV
jgi:hypothetical protein